jgi:hypothetical protein
MHRPGTDPAHVRMEDVLCDFCRAPWVEALPMVEGHRGSVICGRCLSVACATLAPSLREGEGGRADSPCTMCLETRDEPRWISPASPEASICARCIELAARTLERDRDFDWRRPG